MHEITAATQTFVVSEPTRRSCILTLEIYRDDRVLIALASMFVRYLVVVVIVGFRIILLL